MIRKNLEFLAALASIVSVTTAFTWFYYNLNSRITVLEQRIESIPEITNGLKGDKGEQGLPGPTGDKGDPGNTHFTGTSKTPSSTSTNKESKFSRIENGLEFRVTETKLFQDNLIVTVIIEPKESDVTIYTDAKECRISDNHINEYSATKIKLGEKTGRGIGTISVGIRKNGRVKLQMEYTNISPKPNLIESLYLELWGSQSRYKPALENIPVPWQGQ